MGSIPGWGRSPGQRTRQPTPVFLPGESHGQRSLVGCSSLGFQLREPGRGNGHKEFHSLGGRSWTSLISLRYGRRSLTSRYLAFYEERKGPHWKPRIEKVRKHSLRRCPWSPESPTQVSTHGLSLQVWDSPESAGGLRSPGLHPCWLAGRLRACLPSFLPASPVSAPPPRTPGGHRGPRGLRSGCGQDSSLVPRAHCAPRAPACRGALHPPHGLLGVPGSPGVPEG